VSTGTADTRRFRIALTFPGTKRSRVAGIAGCLAKRFPKEQLLYDKFHAAELARPELDVYLPELYRTQSDLIVVFLCPQYQEKKWCRLEWRAIRQLISSVGSESVGSERIMFLSFGPPGDLTGLGIYDSDGYVDIQNCSASYVAELICARLDGLPPPAAPSPTVSSWTMPIAAILALALGMVAFFAFRPSALCSVLAAIGISSSWFEVATEPSHIARLQELDSKEFVSPPVLLGRGESESQEWFIRNRSDRSVGLLVGKLEASERGGKSRPATWEKVQIHAHSQRDWSTGMEDTSSSGVWVVHAFDPDHPDKIISSPKPCRLLMTVAEEVIFKDYPALTLLIDRGHAPNRVEVSQEPLLPIRE